VITLTIVLRVVQLGAATLLVGTFALLLLVDRPTLPHIEKTWISADGKLFDHGLRRLRVWSLLGLFGFGLLGLWVHLVTVTNQSLFHAVSLDQLDNFFLGTQHGRVWLIRLGLMGLLGGCLWYWERERRDRDPCWLRLTCAGLVGGILIAQSWSGHATTTEGIPLVWQALVAVFHLLATGVWLGSLPLLVLFLAWTRRVEAPGVEVMAAHATQRFSVLGLTSVGVLILSGLAKAWMLVGSVPALVGTLYGRLLLLKVGLLLPLLGLAMLNLLHIRPQLLAGAATQRWEHCHQLLTRLQRHVLGEIALGGGILMLVGWLGSVPPARHVDPVWPFAFRVFWQDRVGWMEAKEGPEVQRRLTLGKSITGLGCCLALYAASRRCRRWPWVAGAGGMTIATGLVLSSPWVTRDAYPTTFWRPPVPYHALYIAHGLHLYQQHCAVCHGVAGHGDGPAAPGLWPRPADLTAQPTAEHTDGDLFWWLTYGIKGSAMPGFAELLRPEERWDVVHFLRALAVTEEARLLAPLASATPWLVAPDFTYTTSQGEGRSLSDHRGQNIILLVLFSLPDSVNRLRQLHNLYPSLRERGVEVLGVPLHGSRDISRGLEQGTVVYPIVMDGAAEIAMTYTLFRRTWSSEDRRPTPPMPAHLEFLINRQGYIRARWIPRAPQGWEEIAPFLATIEALNHEEPGTAEPEEHLH
jgi:putative copper export protein/mono/diheme cytochrome c family protein/peroxiredoxin